jgi:hypothetical protein
MSTSKKGSKEPKGGAMPSTLIHGKINNNNHIAKQSGHNTGRKAPPEESKPAKSMETHTSPHNGNEGYESWLSPQSTTGSMLFEEGPPKMCLENILKRAHSLGKDESIEYGELTNSQLESASKKWTSMRPIS